MQKVGSWERETRGSLMFLCFLVGGGCRFVGKVRQSYMMLVFP